MTLPYERYQAIDRTRKWLQLNSNNSKLPRWLREEIQSLLRHFPWEHELEAIAEQAPSYLEQNPDDFVRLIREWQEEVDSNDPS